MTGLVDDLLTYAEAAHALRISTSTLRRLIDAGHIRRTTLPGQGRKYIARADLESYVAKRSHE